MTVTIGNAVDRINNAAKIGQTNCGKYNFEPYDAIGAGRTNEFAYQLGSNAIHLNASPSQTLTRKLTPIDGVKEPKGEHLIPILLKRSAL